jgi:hypothetical protein
MTLAEAETDERFESFKFMSMIDLGIYIAKCTKYIANNSPDYEVSEYLEAAQLINKKRAGITDEESA